MSSQKLKIYLCDYDNNGTNNESIVILFALRFALEKCSHLEDKYSLFFYYREEFCCQKRETVGLDIKFVKRLPTELDWCEPPTAVSGCMVHQGLSAVLRSFLKLSCCHEAKSLLGFHGACLKACAEVSQWTHIVEKQLPQLLDSSKSSKCSSIYPSEYPSVLNTLETLMHEPPSVQNINKRRRELSSQQLERNFLQGIDLTLVDVLAFIYIHEWLRASSVHACIFSIYTKLKEWFMRMAPKCTVLCSRMGFEAFSLPSMENKLTVNDCNLNFPEKCSQIQDVIPHKRISVFQDLSPHLQLSQELDESSNEFFVPIPWHELPEALHPKSGDLPSKRVEKKCQQLENLVCIVKKLCRGNEVIVDFCAGGGHLGLLLAYLLPNCLVILVENKEESQSKAKNRVDQLQLKNILLYQCNLTSLTGRFDLGVSLHACGLVTDLVLEKCLHQPADCVIVPCCYGAIKESDGISYPRSQSWSIAIYKKLVQMADHPREGKSAMQHIDRDRLIYAKSRGFHVMLMSLRPLTCSPKNNILVIQKNPRHSDIDDKL